MARRTGETKQERIARAVAQAVGAGREWHLETVDFSDPSRPLTCLEVDFPILPINHVAAIEGNAGKPIYHMSKWWARRRSSVFRAMLIAAAARAPDDPAEAAKLVWDAYYGNHQKNRAFRRLKVADIFMGGGTTVVEGARLGMQMYGNDLNPVAWFVVKNELAQVDPQEVKKLLAHVEAEVKPQIMPFYACDCPRGHKGKWKKKATGEVMGAEFDPLKLKPEERPDYEYEGPEVIYTFWAKHGPCQATGCGHRTPIMSTPVVAVKTLTVKAWTDRECPHCKGTYDLEQQQARMAPGALFVVASDEKPFAVMDEKGEWKCPHCGQASRNEAAARRGVSEVLGGKAANKKIDLTLLVHPDWLKGAPGKAGDGAAFGGSVTDTARATAAWDASRARRLMLIEVRGKLPEQVKCPDTGEDFFTDLRGGTIPKQKQFVCKEATCGLAQDIVVSVKKSGKSGPVAPLVIQGYCPTCDAEGRCYGGRFFAIPNTAGYEAAYEEWERLREGELASFWPRCEIPKGYMTPVQNDLPSHGYPEWWRMFNPRQLLVHTRLLKSIVTVPGLSWEAKEIVLGAFQQYLRNQNMFCFWNYQRDTPEPLFSNNNFHPKVIMIENCVFSDLGRGNWKSCTAGIVEGCEWGRKPWEIVSVEDLTTSSRVDLDGVAGRSLKTPTQDTMLNNQVLECRSSSDLTHLPDGTYDLVCTDPPFGGLVHYSELADFFYVWLRLVLKDRYPTLFLPDNTKLPETPKALEAVSNWARHPDDADGFYQRILTECWRETWRILKPAGILAFTFHHSEDEPWVAVLESLFDAGFYLVATYPIRSDEIKGEGQFGSKQIEFDIIHVCRKRMGDPSEVSWARLRRQIMQDVRQLEDILAQHQKAGLQAADLQVIRRGKALEYYSRHYGKVYVERGRTFSVKEALLAVNQLLDEQADASTEPPTVLAEAYTRQYLRLFADRTSLARDQMQKYLRGTGISPNEFTERGWCQERQKVFYPISPVELARSWRGVPRSSMSRDFDQAMFMVGACFEGSGITLSDTLNNPLFSPHPAIGDILDWLTRHGGTSKIKDAARTARQLYQSWVAKNQQKVVEQRTLFDLIEGA